MPEARREWHRRRWQGSSPPRCGEERRKCWRGRQDPRRQQLSLPVQEEQWVRGRRRQRQEGAQGDHEEAPRARHLHRPRLQSDLPLHLHPAQHHLLARVQRDHGRHQELHARRRRAGLGLVIERASEIERHSIVPAKGFLTSG